MRSRATTFTSARLEAAVFLFFRSSVRPAARWTRMGHPHDPQTHSHHNSAGSAPERGWLCQLLGGSAGPPPGDRPIRRHPAIRWRATPMPSCEKEKLRCERGGQNAIRELSPHAVQAAREQGVAPPARLEFTLMTRPVPFGRRLSGWSPSDGGRRSAWPMRWHYPPFGGAVWTRPAASVCPALWSTRRPDVRRPA